MLLLEPKHVCVDVTYFREALALDNAFGSAGVDVHPDQRLNAEVLHERLHSKALAGRLHDAVELALGRALRDHSLRFRVSA